jgi:hypothetical protein
MYVPMNASRVRQRRGRLSCRQVNRVNDEVASGNLVSISPFFIVKDLQVSIAHYIERFGFQLDFQGPVVAFFRLRDE